MLAEFQPQKSVGAGALTSRGKVSGTDALHCKDPKPECSHCTCWACTWHSHEATEVAGRLSGKHPCTVTIHADWECAVFALKLQYDLTLQEVLQH